MGSRPIMCSASKMIKRAAAVFSALMLLFALCFECCAAGVMTAGSVKIKNNRLFDVNIRVKGDERLSAATFVLEYDISRFAFREAYTEREDATVTALDKSGEVRVIFLSPFGTKLSAKGSLFSVKFKSLSEGSGKIKITASDCVNSSAESIESFSGTSCAVEVEKTAEKGYAGRGKGNGSGGNAYYGKSKKSSSITSSSTKNDPEDYGVISADSGNRADLMPLYVAISLIVTLVVSALAVIIISRREKTRAEKIRRIKEDELIERYEKKLKDEQDS